jgi:DNA polymerase elongation subunit (family B)
VEKRGKVYPVIVLIGRDENKKRRIYQTVYFPYFYLTEKDYMELKDSEYFKGLHIQDITGTNARSIMKKVMTKITVTDAGRVSDTIKVINKMNKQKEDKGSTVYTYEADLSRSDLLPLRYLIDKKIKSGVDITDEGITPVDFIVPLRIWLIDFECYVDKLYSMKVNPKYPINMVSFWDSYEGKLYTLYTYNDRWKTRPIFKPFGEWHIVKEYKTEPLMLDFLVDLVLEKQPDLLSAWNLNRYDIEIWKMRMEINRNKCIHKFSDISPMHSVLWQNRPHRVKGVILFDLMVAFKQFTDAELRSYSLGAVAEEEKMQYEKIPFIGTPANTWDNYPEQFYKRNVIDVLIMKTIEEKHQLIDTYNDSRIEFGTLFHETFIPHRVIDAALMRLVSGKVILRTTQYDGTRNKERLLGAIVKEPVVGEYYRIAQLDFGREYPNIIKAFNISPETYREEVTEFHKDEFYMIEYKDMKFYFVKNPIGLLPQLINYFFKKRDEYDRAYVEAIKNKEDEAKIKMWWRRQYNIKKKTNAIYGVMDFQKFRLHRKECTQAVAIIGRISIEELDKYATSIGYVILYADTDSMFIVLHSTTPEEQLQELQELQKKFNDHLMDFFRKQYGVNAPAELGMKAIYKKLVLVGKKNYCGKTLWVEKKGFKEEYEFKGIASVRSDSSIIERNSLETLLKMKLDDQEQKVLEDYVEKVLGLFRDREYTPLDLAYPAQLKERLFYNNSKGCWVTTYARLDARGHLKFPAHARSAIYSNMYLNMDYAQGDKPRRLPVVFSKKLRAAEGQSSLFGGKVDYPTEWIYKGKTGGITKDLKIKVKDISIVDGVEIPKFFIGHIDYDRIEKRLKGKLYMVLSIKNSIGMSEGK